MHAPFPVADTVVSLENLANRVGACAGTGRTAAAPSVEFPERASSIRDAPPVRREASGKLPPAAVANRPDSWWIAGVLNGDESAFEPLVTKYQPRIFATARRYARRESEVEDIVQEVFIRAYQKMPGFRGEAPFEHWLMRLAVRTCFNYLRAHQRNRETSFTELSQSETDWLDTYFAAPGDALEHADAARQLIARILNVLSPSARLVITLLEIEERSTREIAELTGWTIPMVKVKAFRARAEMRKRLAKLPRAKYL